MIPDSALKENRSDSMHSLTHIETEVLLYVWWSSEAPSEGSWAGRITPFYR